MSKRASQISAQQYWMDECLKFSYDSERFDTVVEAEWPDEQDLYRIMADGDDAFFEKVFAAITFLEENQLWLAVEQCCDQGIWLPPEMRFERLKTCPTDMRSDLDQLIATCEVHVLLFVARMYWMLVRMDRHERTGSASWRPAKQ